MGSIIDYMVSSIIVGLLTMTIFSAHLVMIDSSAETRVTYGLQNHADSGLQLIQEQLRDLRSIEAADDESITYTSVNNELVYMAKVGKELSVSVLNQLTGEVTDKNYALHLDELKFELLPVAGVDDALLRVKVETVSRPEMEAGQREHRYRATATRDIYLRNMHLNN